MHTLYNNGDGSLAATCNSGKYETVLLAFLAQFGSHREPKLNFAGHCGYRSRRPCTKLESQIKYCQSIGVKVSLSLGGADVRGYDYGLSSPQDAKNVAKYLYDNFLSGQYGPLGNVALDGIDLDIQNTDLYWDDLVKELDTYRQSESGSNYFYLSAAPQCITEPEIPYLQKAIDTALFDFIYVKFYNNPQCSYSPYTGVDPVLNSWNNWVSIVEPYNSTIYLGLPAGRSAAGYGYIPPHVLINEVIPNIKTTPKIYGGIMLWSRYYDIKSDYSGKILHYATKSNVILKIVKEAVFESVSSALNRIIPKA